MPISMPWTAHYHDAHPHVFPTAMHRVTMYRHTPTDWSTFPCQALLGVLGMRRYFNKQRECVSKRNYSWNKLHYITNDLIFIFSANSRNMFLPNRIMFLFRTF